MVTVTVAHTRIGKESFGSPMTYARIDESDTTHAAILAALRPIINAPPVGIDPRAQRVTLRSAALGVRKSFYVLLPPSYDAQDGRYPVLYLLRGHEREWVNPSEDASRVGTVVDVYRRLLRAGRIGSMILVCPGLTSDDGRVHGLATDFRARKLAPMAPGLGTGRFETYMMREVVPLIDALYRGMPGQRRGLDGFSLGGFMAVKLAARYPDVFATAGAYDGTFLYTSADGKRVKEDQVFRAPFLDPVFGLPRDQPYAAANNGPNLIVDSSRDRVRSVRWLIQYGREEIEPMGSNYYRGAYLRDLLTMKGIAHDIPAVIPDGAHDWATADRHIEATLPLHWDALR